MRLYRDSIEELPNTGAINQWKNRKKKKIVFINFLTRQLSCEDNMYSVARIDLLRRSLSF